MAILKPVAEIGSGAISIVSELYRRWSEAEIPRKLLLHVAFSASTDMLKIACCVGDENGAPKTRRQFRCWSYAPNVCRMGKGGAIQALCDALCGHGWSYAPNTYFLLSRFLWRTIWRRCERMRSNGRI